MKPVDINHIALLSRLSLSEDEKDRFTKELDLFSVFSDDLSDLDPTAIPDYYDGKSVSVTRSDFCDENIYHKYLLDNATALSEDGTMITVPKVL